MIHHSFKEIIDNLENSLLILQFAIGNVTLTCGFRYDGIYETLSRDVCAVVLHTGHLIILLHTLAVRKENKINGTLIIIYVTSLNIFLTRQNLF